jgi:hypothetical protein
MLLATEVRQWRRNPQSLSPKRVDRKDAPDCSRVLATLRDELAAELDRAIPTSDSIGRL